MDEGIESSASMSGAFGMRVFDAGEFHVGVWDRGAVGRRDDRVQR